MIIWSMSQDLHYKTMKESSTQSVFWNASSLLGVLNCLLCFQLELEICKDLSRDLCTAYNDLFSQLDHSWNQTSAFRMKRKTLIMRTAQCLQSSVQTAGEYLIIFSGLCKGKFPWHIEVSWLFFWEFSTLKTKQEEAFLILPGLQFLVLFSSWCLCFPYPCKIYEALY